MRTDPGSGAIVARVHALLTSEDDGRVCKDIPEAACREQPGNFVKHVVSLAATKTGDGLADPKLVLTWLLTELGAPATALGWLVPVREAGALLPQLGIAAWIRARPRRKLVWAAGSAVQGLAVAGVAAVALVGARGAVAGWAVVSLLAVFALARSACSVSYKDVLGKTVAKATRGTATGAAGTIAAAAVFAFGATLATGLLPTTVGVLAGGLLVAAGLWLGAAALFATLREEPGATEGGGNPLQVAAAHLGLLRADPQLRRFLAARGLLIATALAPPYMLQAAGGNGGDAAAAGDVALRLGPLVVASSSAAVLSSYVWGRLADRSSRRVLLVAALVGAAALGTTAAFATAAPRWLAAPGVLPVLLFVLMVGYQGVRLGRATHLVDMASADKRAAYTALSNTAIGVLLLLGGLFGLLAQVAGSAAVLVVFALMSLLAAAQALRLDEVQRD